MTWNERLKNFNVPKSKMSGKIFQYIPAESCGIFFYVLLTVHLITIFVNNQLDAQFFFLYLFIPILYMFRVTKCSSSGESIVSTRPLAYVTLGR